MRKSGLQEYGFISPSGSVTSRTRTAEQDDAEGVHTHDNIAQEQLGFSDKDDVVFGGGHAAFTVEPGAVSLHLPAGLPKVHRHAIAFLRRNWDGQKIYLDTYSNYKEYGEHPLHSAGIRVYSTPDAAASEIRSWGRVHESRANSLITSILTEISHQKLARRIADTYALLPAIRGEQQPANREGGRGARRKVSHPKPPPKHTPGRPFPASRQRMFAQTEGNCLNISVALARKYGGRPSHPHGVLTPGETPTVEEDMERVTTHARNLYEKYRDRMAAVGRIESITDPREMEEHLHRNSNNLRYHLNPQRQKATDPSEHLLSVLRRPGLRGVTISPEARVRAVHKEARRLGEEAGSLSYPRHIGDPGAESHGGHYIVVRAGADLATPQLHVAFEHRKHGEFNYGSHGSAMPIIGRIPLLPAGAST